MSGIYDHIHYDYVHGALGLFYMILGGFYIYMGSNYKKYKLKEDKSELEYKYTVNTNYIIMGVIYLLVGFIYLYLGYKEAHTHASIHENTDDLTKIKTSEFLQGTFPQGNNSQGNNSQNQGRRQSVPLFLRRLPSFRPSSFRNLLNRKPG